MSTGSSTFNRGLPLHLRELKNVYYDGGVPWILTPDDEGVLHIAILIEISPSETRNVAANVRLELYTNSLDGGRTPYRLLVNDVGNLNNSTFNPPNPTKILIHGFGGNGQHGVIINSRNGTSVFPKNPTRLWDLPGPLSMGTRGKIAAYLARGNYNIIGVDWGVLAAAPNHIAAVANTRVVGTHIAKLIDFHVAQTGAIPADFHLTGFSLGANVAGFAGKKTRGRVGRITGLSFSVEEISVGLGPSSSVSNTSFQTAVY